MKQVCAFGCISVFYCIVRCCLIYVKAFFLFRQDQAFLGDRPKYFVVIFCDIFFWGLYLEVHSYR